MSSHTKSNLLTSFHIHSFAIFRTDLQSNTIVTCILAAWNQIMTNMQDHLLQLMQLIQFWHVSPFSTIITNNFIREDIALSQYSLNGYESMGFEVEQSTQNQEQKIFSLRTNKPIPVAVYDTPIMWAKHGNHILPPNLPLTNNNKVGLHQSLCGFFIVFLCKDLEKNLSFALNSHCVPSSMNIFWLYSRECQN